MSNEAYLGLLLDAPMQSWGFASRFQRRTSALHPTKSGVIGLIAAAMGLEKGSREEAEKLPTLRALLMHVALLPKAKWWIRQPAPERRSDWLELSRLEDYHTVGGGFDPETEPQCMPRTALGKPDKDPTVSRREYLNDARFGLILVGPSNVLTEVAEALRDPVWGIWLGRKSCIPAAPVILPGSLMLSREEAWTALLGAVNLPLEIPFGAFGSIEEVASASDPHITIMDQPVSFGDGTSSGPDKRQFASRRIAVRPGIRQQ